MQPVRALERAVQESGSLLLGYSGGVDSALLAVVTRDLLGPGHSLAVLAVSPSLSARQRQQAHQIAERFDLTFEEIRTAEVDDPRYRANPSNRCFFCKHTLWQTLVPMAAARGYRVVADGTNADDTGGHRPGHAAGHAFGVVSPLLNAGMTKQDVRAEARRRGLPIWDAPAAPCLASRVRFGVEVTPEILFRVEQAEEALRAIGVRGDLRVRHRGAEARIEVEPDQISLVRDHADRLGGELHRLGWSMVTLDADGYSSGSQLDPVRRVEPLMSS